MIVFTSDHGEILVSHGLWQKMCSYEESIKSPLYIKFPKKDQIITSEHTECVSIIDVMPTICDYFDIQPKHKMDGVSLLSDIVNNRKIDRAVYSQYDGNAAISNPSRAILDEGYKLMITLFKDEGFAEIYNLSDDPYEKTNLINDKASRQIILDLYNKLRLHMGNTHDICTLPKNISKIGNVN